ncbi:MAG: carbohydrate porin [Pseudorhodoplanes sp.]|nr:carbohydrate porin [Pseudorhodoplanes sp.]
MTGRRACARGVAIGVAAAMQAVALSAAPALAQSDLWQREKLTGDWGGARTALSARGVEVGVVYIGETLSVTRGGVRTGTTFEGRLETAVDTDLEKLLGWKGASTHIKMFQIHNGGRNAADLVQSIADPSNIDALRSTRLFTVWFQQNFFGDAVSIRAGQLAADDEFLISKTAGGLINGTFGWAAINAANIRSGGPAYPLAAPGVRLALKPTNEIAFLAAVLGGDPAGRNCTEENPQACNKHGTKFRPAGGALWIGELQYAVNQGEQAAGLAAAYKIGAWYATDRYADQRFGLDPATGAVLTLAADPPPEPLFHERNWGVYGVIDQMLWRMGERSTSVFVRGGMTPSDRNTVSGYVDGGIGFKGPFAGRPNDLLTLGFAHSRLSRRLADLDRDTLALNGPPYPIRSAETVFEASYILQLAPWWSVQPDIQYIARPGGNVPHPDTGEAVRNAVVVGVRSSVNF